jgi:hypothetical protein
MLNIIQKILKKREVKSQAKFLVHAVTSACEYNDEVFSHHIMQDGMPAFHFGTSFGTKHVVFIFDDKKLYANVYSHDTLVSVHDVDTRWFEKDFSNYKGFPYIFAIEHFLTENVFERVDYGHVIPQPEEL